MLRAAAVRLKRGEQVEIRPSGHSMEPLIKHRQPVLIEPVGSRVLTKGDIVLAKVSGRLYLHCVHAVRGQQVQIANATGDINGWTSMSNIYGVVVSVDS